MKLVQDMLNSKGKIKLLSLLLERPFSFSVSELSRLSDIPKATASLVIKDWEKAGLVETQTQGRNKLVKINQKFLLLSELKAIFKKSKNFNDPLFGKVQKIPSLKNPLVLAVMVFGSRVRNDFVHSSDLDVLVALESKNTSLTEKIMEEFIKLSEDADIRFSPTFLDKKEIKTRLKEKDHFIKNILMQGKILKGAKWLEHLQSIS